MSMGSVSSKYFAVLCPLTLVAKNVIPFRLSGTVRSFADIVSKLLKGSGHCSLFTDSLFSFRKNGSPRFHRSPFLE
jgi:hypothetical protein